MSFILDALKKSEIERQRQSVPGLIDMPVPARRRRVPAWVWVLVGLLGINVAVLLVLLTRTQLPSRPPLAGAATTTGEPQSRDKTPRAAPKAAIADPDHFSPLDNAPVYAQEIPVADAPAPTTAAPLTLAPIPHADIPLRTARRADPVLNDEPSENDEMLPSLSELNLTGAQSLPEIHLDVHVYATRAADRFVYINMRKYHEGAVLQEGPTLERIRRDGVVLNYNGLRFIVPRQS